LAGALHVVATAAIPVFLKLHFCLVQNARIEPGNCAGTPDLILVLSPKNGAGHGTLPFSVSLAKRVHLLSVLFWVILELEKKWLEYGQA